MDKSTLIFNGKKNKSFGAGNICISKNAKGTHTEEYLRIAINGTARNQFVNVNYIILGVCPSCNRNRLYLCPTTESDERGRKITRSNGAVSTTFSISSIKEMGLNPDKLIGSYFYEKDKDGDIFIAIGK